MLPHRLSFDEFLGIPYAEPPVGHLRWLAVGLICHVGALPFADNDFDVVTAMHMLYHAPDKDRAVAEIARVLKPGGLLIATTNGNDALKELTDLTQAVFGPQPKDFGHVIAPASGS